MTLRADDVWFRYSGKSRWVVAGVSLSVEPGEVVGLHGPSGAGKSTLGRLLSGILRAQRGQVCADGRAPRPGRGTANPVQLVSQHALLSLDPLWKIRRSLAETGVGEDVLDRLDPALAPPALLDRFPHEISGGEAQRVNLGRALLADPRFLVADEITASLDPISQVEIWELVRAAVESRRIGVLAISHDRPLLDAVAHRVLDFQDLVDAPSTPRGR
ncbi:ATP-binding cassette domain-containing protein [Saccharothrix sp. 6-C]|uniref:ABC transporter ATP-binding protein n=1 Tax=Saccharothrix sp. 6-C TaxID=2781735 RepID=UPI0019178C40|nr:ATP-binding cassette domain-containing protein [Saccharothrix sp. 6-C]QQQ73441.1 ATP-binding cassette domain-containing protein [Saccharothrix sp. 6-C]